MEDIIIGRNPVIEAINSGRSINKILVAENSKGPQYQKLTQMAKDAGVILNFVPRKKIDGIVEGQHQGVVAYVAAYQYAELDDLFEVAKSKNEDPFFIILDELEDPHNLGSIMRTADAVGAHGIIIPKRRSVGLTSTVAKASTGAIEYVKVARVTNLAQTIDQLKEKGLWVFGTDASAKEDYQYMDGTLPLALIIGSEGRGISKLVLSKCDFKVKLPMKGKVTSLNASVAASILMYEVFRKRLAKGE